MPPIGRIKSGTCRVLKTAVAAIRQRFWVLVVTILGICAPIYAMAWYFQVGGDLASRVAITGLVTTLLVIVLRSPPEWLTYKSHYVWLSVFSWLALALFIGGENDWRFMTFNLTLVFMALPYVWVFWQIVRHEWLVSVGFALVLAATMFYWIAALVINEAGFDFLLLPLPVVLFVGIFWAPIALLALKSARRRKNQRISGPGMQALAMTILFIPVALVALTLPKDLGLDTVWSNVSLALIGIFLSGVISEPLRRFLLEWGDLNPVTSPPE